MTTCTLHPVVTAERPSLARRLLAGFWRNFHWPVLVSRELV